jgi:Leucine-rich repeat (LRR) protein
METKKRVPLTVNKFAISLLLIFRLFCLSEAQDVVIPDKAFLDALIERGVDIDNDGLISHAEAESVNCLDISLIDTVYRDGHWECWPMGNVSSLSGIEAFTNLDTLICAGNDLMNLLLPDNPGLLYVDCRFCGARTRISHSDQYYVQGGIRSIDVSKCVDLKYLDCSRNRISSLDISGIPALKSLKCSENRLESLFVSQSHGLTVLNCDHNGLTGLDISENPSLIDLNCAENELIFLDIAGNPKLGSLDCSGNHLLNLNISNSHELKKLLCARNELTCLDVTNNPAIRILDCSDNGLTVLNLARNLALEELSCGFNQLTELDVSCNKLLTSLSFPNNSITILDISNNERLEELDCSYNSLFTLDLSNNTELSSLICGSNLLSYLDVSKNNRLAHLNAGGRNGHLHNNLRFLDLSKNIALIALDCSYNQLVGLDLSNNTNLSYLSCGNNRLNFLDISKNTGLEYLEAENMPTLSCVSVWELPFPSTRIFVDSRGSTNFTYTTGSCSITGGIGTNSPLGLSIYPNPVKDQLTIVSGKHEGCVFELTSLNGQLIYRAELEGTVSRLGLSSLKSGMYILTINCLEFTMNKKIIKY